MARPFCLGVAIILSVGEDSQVVEETSAAGAVAAEAFLVEGPAVVGKQRCNYGIIKRRQN